MSSYQAIDQEPWTNKDGQGVITTTVDVLTVATGICGDDESRFGMEPDSGPTGLLADKSITTLTNIPEGVPVMKLTGSIVTTTPLAFDRLFSLRQRVKTLTCVQEIPGEEDVRPGPTGPGSYYQEADMGWHTSATLPGGEQGPGVGIWDPATNDAMERACLEYATTFDVVIGTPSFLTAAGNEEQAARFVARYFLEMLRQAPPLGFTSQVVCGPNRDGETVSIKVAGSFSIPMYTKRTFQTGNPVYILPALSLEMKKKFERTACPVTSLPSISTLLIPAFGRRGTGYESAGGAPIQQFSYYPVAHSDVMAVFGCLPDDEFKEALDRAFIGRVSTTGGDLDGVALDVCLLQHA